MSRNWLLMYNNVLQFTVLFATFAHYYLDIVDVDCPVVLLTVLCRVFFKENLQLHNSPSHPSLPSFFPFPPSPSLPFFSLPFPSPFSGGPGASPPEKFLELEMLIGEFLEHFMILDIKINIVSPL